MMLQGAISMGKSTVFESIALLMAVIDFANPDVTPCVARVLHPEGLLPHAYLASAMSRHEILTDEHDVLPIWCHPEIEMRPYERQVALQRWIDGKKRDHGQHIVPVLLLDNFERGNSSRISSEMKSLVIDHLRVMADQEWSMVMRITGVWPLVAEHLSDGTNKTDSLYRSIAKQELRGMSSPMVEALLFCLQGNAAIKNQPRTAISYAIAKRMLQDDRLVLLRKHGFLQPTSSLESGAPTVRPHPVVSTI